MKRSFVYLTALAGFGGMVLLAGGAQAQGPGGAPQPGGAPSAPATARPTVAVFNMAAVMREYHKAKYQVYLLNQKRVGMSGEVTKLKEQYLQLQDEGKKSKDPAVQERIGKQLVDITRIVEDKERIINKALNDEASKIISDLYDDIKNVVNKTAEMNGYHIVFAYPDAVTEDEMKNAYLKELKLKPPAAQPFYVARHVDLTGVVIDTLNKWYPAKDAQGNAVDVNSLPQPGATNTGTPAGAPQPGGAPGLPTGGAPSTVPGGAPGRP